MIIKAKGTVTMPKLPRSIGNLVNYSKEVNKAIQQLRDRAWEVPGPMTKGPDTKPPLWITIYKDGEDFKIYSEYGHVLPRHNNSGATGAPISISSLPTFEAPLTVEGGDKVYVTISVNVNGQAISAEFEKATSWPSDTPPVLVGGDLGGSSGFRYVRIAELNVDPSNADNVLRDQLITGHIDHFQPVLVENLISSPSTGEARVLQQWNASAGRWDLRYLVAGDGIEIEESGDTIVISNTLFTYTP
jgi:hypothetical protein